MKDQLLNLRNILFGIGAVFQAAICLLLLRQTFADPGYLKQVDYIAIYSGGYITRYESLSQLYDLDLQRQVQAEITAPLQLSRFYPLNHPPLLARILQLTSTTDYTIYYTRWILVLAIVFCARCGKKVGSSGINKPGWLLSCACFSRRTCIITI